MKRIKLAKSWLVKAPRDKIYRIVTDFENLPKYFPRVAQSLYITSRQGNYLIIDAKAKSFGKIISTRMNVLLVPPRGYVSDNDVSSIGTSGHEEFLMDEIPEGTRINYSYEVQISNFLWEPFARFLIGNYAIKFWEKAVINRLRELLEK